MTRLRREGCGRRPSKRRGASLYKTFKTGLRPMENRPTALAGGENVPPLVAGATTFAPVGSVSLDSQSPKGSLRIQFPCHPASGGTTTRDLLCATYEIIASRSFIVPPLQRGEGGAVGTKGGKPPEVANHRKAVLDDESKSISRNAAFPPTCIYHCLSQMQRVPRFFAVAQNDG